MTTFLVNKQIVIGVTGSIAAYKSADLVRKLREAGAQVRVVMTEHAKQFITPLTLQALSGYPVHDDLFDPQIEAAMGHIELAKWADVVLIAPASADCLARLAAGRANDLLTAVCLATTARIVLTPAMNQGMWHDKQTQQNQQALKAKHVTFFGPDTGPQACGDKGLGRMLQPEDIITKLNGLFAQGRLANVNILITAGPTHEYLDPIRYITNRSTGKMGFALAQAAREASANVKIIAGPVTEPLPKALPVISVTSGQEMYDAVLNEIHSAHMFISVAAVSDYRVASIASQKLQKSLSNITLDLQPNPDILLSVSKQRAAKLFVVGFAAETENMLARARLKMEQKNMDMIIANHVHGKLGMGSDDNQVTVLAKDKQWSFPLMSKIQLAQQLITLIADVYFAVNNNSLLSPAL